MNEPSGSVLIPPRPNLGPEPLIDSQASVNLGFGIGIAILLALLALIFVVFLRRRSRRGKRLSGVPMFPDTSDESERERMIAWSIAVREALASRFGNVWKARTTEEIADDPQLLAQIGSERSERLIRFLREADRAKFADSSAALDYFDFDGLAELLTPPAPAAGARSKTNGA